MQICNGCKEPKEKYYAGNRVCVDCFRERRYAHRRANPKLRMLSCAKMRAKEQSVPFNLTVPDFEIPGLCPILGIKLELNRGRGGFKDSSPSLDKIIPSKGYVKGNVVVISYRANRLKGDATVEEIESLVEWLKSVLTPESLTV